MRPAKILGFIALKVFSLVFKTSKEVAREAGPQFNSVVKSVSKIGTKRLKEVVGALPIFVLFFLELLRNRDKIQAQKQLFIIGAAAAFSTLGLTVLGALLSSIPVQLGLLFTHPLLGISLLTSEGLVITTVIVSFVWLIIYALNFLLADDPAFQKIREQILPPNTQAILSEVQAEIESSGADLDKLRVIVEERLKARGSEADAKKLEKELQRIEKKLRSRALNRLSKAASRAEAEANV